ncbi:hypothetical protein ACRPOS_007555 [Bartonella heixiaziensis]
MFGEKVVMAAFESADVCAWLENMEEERGGFVSLLLLSFLVI